MKIGEIRRYREYFVLAGVRWEKSGNSSVSLFLCTGHTAVLRISYFVHSKPRTDNSTVRNSTEYFVQSKTFPGGE